MTHQVVLISYQEPLAEFLDLVTTVVSNFLRHQRSRLISSYAEECRTVAEQLKRSVNLTLTMDSGWDPLIETQGLMRKIPVSLVAENVETSSESHSESNESYRKRIRINLFKYRSRLSIICVLPSVIETCLSLIPDVQVAVLPIFAKITINSSTETGEITEMASDIDELQRLIIPQNPVEATVEKLSKSFKEEFDETIFQLVEGRLGPSVKVFGRSTEEDAKNQLNLLSQKCAQIKDTLDAIHSGIDETTPYQLQALGTRIDEINSGRKRLEADLGTFLSSLDSLKSSVTRTVQVWTELKSEVSAHSKPDQKQRNLPITIYEMQSTAEGYVALLCSKKHYSRPYELVIHGIDKKISLVDVNGGYQQVKVADYGMLAPGEYMVFFRERGNGQHSKSNTFYLDISTSTPSGPSE